jgi:hypothetical protein
MAKSYKVVQEDLKRLKNHIDLTTEERAYLYSLVDLLGRVERKMLKINPTVSRTDFRNHAMLLDYRFRISKIIEEMLKDAENKWNYLYHRKLYKNALKGKLNRLKQPIQR